SAFPISDIRDRVPSDSSNADIYPPRGTGESLLLFGFDLMQLPRWMLDCQNPGAGFVFRGVCIPFFCFNFNFSTKNPRHPITALQRMAESGAQLPRLQQTAGAPAAAPTTPASTSLHLHSGAQRSQRRMTCLIMPTSYKRMCCLDGYLDSQKLVYQYQLHSPKFSVDHRGAERDSGAHQDAGGGGAKTAPKSKSGGAGSSSGRRPGEADRPEQIGQSKQTERVAKRREGDILKDQREIRVARREMTGQQQTENQRLNRGMSGTPRSSGTISNKLTTLVHQRMQEALQQREEDLNSGRKVMNKSLSLSRQYRAKLDSLQLKRLEVDRLMADYEKRLRLETELGDDLGMEAIKGGELSLQQLRQRQLGEKEKVRQDREEETSVEEQLNSAGSPPSSPIRNERLDAKKRQDDRELIDTRTALNMETRGGSASWTRSSSWPTRTGDGCELNSASMRPRDRRRQQTEEQMSERREAADESEATYAERAQQRAAAAQRGGSRRGATTLPVVSKLEDEEASLYQRVRSTEASRQDEEQQVRRLAAQLRRARGRGASESLQRLAASNREARQLEEELLRHQSRLDSLTAEREEAYLRLEGKRLELARDRDTMEREKLERDRMLSIGENK
uniref:Lebercilin domain-containing protein n=1 Tax=Macrostomum lignano TaxID=282301 RepID=A0A1I8GK19_9PLAT